MQYSVFKVNKESSHLDSPAFFGESISIQRYDTQKYRQIDKLTDKQTGFFWRPTEIDLTKDSKDFKDLSAHEKHIFTSNLKRQILLDSVQGRAPSLAFLPIVSLPEIEAWTQTWTYFEGIHSRSYTHIIQNVYSDPSAVFDEMLEIKEIVDCANDITRYYDELIEKTSWYNLLGCGTHIVNGREINIDMYDLKKSLWLCLMSINILEGIRFYGSFVASFSFGETKRMEGNAKIIKFICRDENIHLAFTQSMIKILLKEDLDFVKIFEETRDECIEMFRSAAEQEKNWSRYLFKDGSVIGLNEALMNEYIEWTTNKRMVGIGLPGLFKTGNNPLPWSQKWIGGGNVQIASQESESVQYTVGGIIQDIEDDTFKGFSL